MQTALTLWYVYVSFGLPVSLCRKVVTAVRDPLHSRLWRAGRVSFYMGIMVWCPHVFLTRLAGIDVPFAPVAVAHAILLYGGLAVQYGARSLPPAAEAS